VEDISKINKELQGYFDLMKNPKIKQKKNFKKFVKKYPKKWQKIQQKNKIESK
tara:strand:+ start:365 stop:523 length:159 start_codon:yes stop_codon:yes gene_type:complete